jgi:hypothetical protein
LDKIVPYQTQEKIILGQVEFEKDKEDIKYQKQ